MTIKLNDYRPDDLEALRYIDNAAADLREEGMSAEAVANLMLYAACRLYGVAQGADSQADGWPQRAHERFQRAVAGFCVENCNATITDAGDVLLPCLSGPDADSGIV